ncbi:MAG: glycosyltransferase [Acidobacteria bacterium]|nr:glycosyltransferase [Acidobacteriota bacterium]
MTIFYIFASLLIIQSLVSLKQGFDYLSYFQRFKNTSDFRPKTAVIAPCKGLDDAMSDYLKSLFEQDYTNYQIVFVVENKEDPAFKLINAYQAKYPKIKSECLIAGKSKFCGQKVHNLQAAISSLNTDIEAFVFVDSDVCLPTYWLKELVSPLADKDIGVTTGYRWFVPTDNRFASLMRSLWNGSIATSLGDHKNNFAWGGSMAILRETFEKINVKTYWQKTISDDYALTKAVRDAKLYIKFIPLCLVPSLGGCSLRDLLEFTTRQIIITKVYSPNLWRLLFFSNLMFNSVFFLGLFLGIYEILFFYNYLPLLMILIIYFLGVWKSYLRIKAIKLVLISYKNIISKDQLAHYLLSPLVAVIFLYNLVMSLKSNKIAWRGVIYNLKSDNLIEIIDGQ